MNAEEITERRAALIEKYGPWTAHNIHLGHGIYTMGRDDPHYEEVIRGYARSLRRMSQIASDLTGRDVGSLRVLDLACLEGIYAVEFALRGAEAVGVDAREGHVAKACLAKDALGLDSLTFRRDDVGNLSLERYGRFDVVLCIGILYHLEAADAIRLLERIYEVCGRVAIIETQFALTGEASHTHAGREYRGWVYKEHEPEASTEQKEKSAWASIDNNNSFWFTRPSIYDLLGDAGFTTAYSCALPQMPGQIADREVFVAVKGRAVSDPLCFGDVRVPPARWDERWREPGIQDQRRA